MMSKADPALTIVKPLKLSSSVTRFPEGTSLEGPPEGNNGPPNGVRNSIAKMPPSPATIITPTTTMIAISVLVVPLREDLLLLMLLKVPLNQPIPKDATQI